VKKSTDFSFIFFSASFFNSGVSDGPWCAVCARRGGGESLTKDLKGKANSLSRDTRQTSEEVHAVRSRRLCHLGVSERMVRSKLTAKRPGVGYAY